MKTAAKNLLLMLLTAGATVAYYFLFIITISSLQHNATFTAGQQLILLPLAGLATFMSWRYIFMNVNRKEG